MNITVTADKPVDEKHTVKVTVPAAVASVDPTYTAQVVANANAQLAAAVVITALVAPAFTGWLDKKLAKKNDAGEVQASEEVSATE